MPFQIIDYVWIISAIHYKETYTLTDVIQTLELYPLRQRLTGTETNIYLFSMTDQNTHPLQEE